MTYVKLLAPVTGCIVYVAPENVERYKERGYKEPQKPKKAAAKPQEGK